MWKKDWADAAVVIAWVARIEGSEGVRVHVAAAGGFPEIDCPRGCNC